MGGSRRQDAPKRPSRLSAIIKSTGADFRALDKHVAAVGTLKAGYNNFYKDSQGVFQSCERIWFKFLVHYQCIYVVHLRQSFPHSGRPDRDWPHPRP